MKSFTVSVLIEGFASVKVEADSKQQAEQKAMQSHYSEFEVQKYTVQPRVVESVTEAD
jgi:hypothetical protein